MSPGVKATAADGGRQSEGCYRPSMGLFNGVDTCRSEATSFINMQSAADILFRCLWGGGVPSPIDVMHGGKRLWYIKRIRFQINLYHATRIHSESRYFHLEIYSFFLFKVNNLIGFDLFIWLQR